MDRMKAQAKDFGAEFVKSEVVGFDLSDKIKVKLKEGEIKKSYYYCDWGRMHKIRVRVRILWSWSILLCNL